MGASRGASIPSGGDGALLHLSHGAALDDDEILWRRVHEDHLKDDGSLSSLAFTGYELSVDRGRIQQDMSLTMGGQAGVAELTAADCRSLGQDPVEDPLPDNLAHALVIGTKSKSIRRRMRSLAKFVRREDIVDVP